jgi:hypothetical protein
VLLHRREHPIGRRSNPSRVDRRGGFTGWVQGRMHHGVNGLRSAENLGGLVVPGDPLLGEGAGFVFGVPGLQRGLLSQVQHLHRRWWPTMIMLELCRQLTASGSRCWPAGPTSEGSRRDRRRRSQLWKAWRRDRPFPAESAESLAPADSAGSTAWMDVNRFDTSLEIGMDVTRFDTSLEIGKFRSAW